MNNLFKPLFTIIKAINKMRPIPVYLLIFSFLSCNQHKNDEVQLLRLLDNQATGIDFVNQLHLTDTFNNLNFEYIFNGGGVGIGDLNNDGLPDVYFTGNMVSGELYLNKGHMHFEKITQAAGVTTRQWSTGVAIADVNADGMLDIYVSVSGSINDGMNRKNLLFINQGTDDNGIPKYLEQADSYGLADSSYTTQAAFFDYDLDGDLDVYLLNATNESHPKNLIVPRLLDGSAPNTDKLYRNEGPGPKGHPVFVDVSDEAGVLIEGYGLGISVVDVNSDQWPDIYVSNDYLSNDILYVNNRDGTFTNRIADYFKHQSQFAMGNDAADINNDGLVDIFTLDMLPEDPYRKKMMSGAMSYDKFEYALEFGYEPQYLRNTLQLNRGTGPNGKSIFSEIGRLAGIHQTDWSWSPLFIDLDLDGYKDLVITNGHYKDVTDYDFVMFRSFVRSETKLQHAMDTLRGIKTHNYAFKNNGVNGHGGLTFSDKSSEWDFHLPSFSNGAATADLDNDGDLDYIVNNIDQPCFVYENNAQKLNRHFLKIKLKSNTQNRYGFGAKADIFYTNGRQTQTMHTVRGFQSSVEPILHFGLDTVKHVDKLIVTWPDGKTEVINNIASDQTITLHHQDANAPNNILSEQSFSTAIFHKANSKYNIHHKHIENEYIDFGKEPLLPRQYSELGPALAVGDANGDGLEDFFIGGSYGKPAKIWLQQPSGRFTATALDYDHDHEDTGAIFFDADNDGDIDLYVVSGGNEFPITNASFYQDRLYINRGNDGDGKPLFHKDQSAIPELPVSGSAVDAADYDGDGDLDLIVAGRLIPRKYPLPAKTYILRNDSKSNTVQFTDVTNSTCPELEQAGMVSDVIWTDFNHDGQMDIILVGEWMPIIMLKNENGQFKNITKSAGLAQTNGWWNGIAAGDYDNDGDTDYLVGNLGNNHGFNVSKHKPVSIYAKDFDKNGSIDPLIFQYQDNRQFPIAPRDAVTEQIFWLKSDLPNYSDYARLDLEGFKDLLDFRNTYTAVCNIFESVYIENLGSGKFVHKPLPIEAQYAPVNDILTGDFNGDGFLDAILTGNDYTYMPIVGRFDASVGLLIIGDGQGGFKSVSPGESGIITKGDTRGIGAITHSSRKQILLIANNDDSLQVFEKFDTHIQKSVRPVMGENTVSY